MGVGAGVIMPEVFAGLGVILPAGLIVLVVLVGMIVLVVVVDQ